MAEQTKTPKEDGISDLPDCLIQHILSFLPTTKQAIQTTVLSKRWHNQWTGVSVLILNTNGTLCKNILKFHNCSKIKKLHWPCDAFNFWNNKKDTYFDEIVCFATRRHVEDLEFLCHHVKYRVLPQSFFENISLCKLRMEGCNFMPRGKVNWASLKELNICSCHLTNEAIEHILCGSPLLELIEISYSSGYDKFAITSKYLKRLVLIYRELRLLEISCPNLKELTLQDIWIKDSSLFDQAIKNVLSVSLLLESLKLVQCKELSRLVISSESLKRLVIGNIRYIPNLQVSCTKLENIEFYGVLNFGKVEFTNLPSSVRVNLDFPHQGNSVITEIHGSLIKDILQQLHHVNELKLGKWFIEVLPGLEPRDIFSPVPYTKCLTLDKAGWFDHQSEVAFILHNSPMLETLVIIESDWDWHGDGNPELTDAQENYWNSIVTVFNCLESHLKMIKVVGIPIGENRRKLLLNFLEFLLRKSRVLETMVITSFWIREFKERLLGSLRLSQHGMVELKKWE